MRGRSGIQTDLSIAGSVGPIGPAANAPHNTNILDMTGGTGHVLIDVANSLLRANTENHDPMIDFSGSTQNGYLNFDDSGAGLASIIIFGSVQLAGTYQLQFDTAAHTYIQNDGSNNLNISNTNGGGTISINASDHLNITSSMSTNDIYLGYGNNLSFTLGGGGSIQNVANVYGGYFYGDGGNVTNIQAYNIVGLNNPPIDSSGNWTGNLNANGYSLDIPYPGGITFESGAVIRRGGGSSVMSPNDTWLIAMDGTTVSLDWSGSADGGASLSFDNTSRSVQFIGSIWDSASVKTIDPTNRLLVASDGTTTVIDYSSLAAAQNSLGIDPFVSADLTSKTSAQSSVVTVTAPADGGIPKTYIVGGYLLVNSVSVNTITLQVTYTDRNSVSRTQSFFPQGTTVAAVGTTGPFTFPDITIRVLDNTAITVKTITTGAGSENYDVGGWIQRVN